MTDAREAAEDYAARRGEEERIVDSTTGGAKGRKPARFDLLPPDALWEIAEQFGYGATKYDDRNWEKGYDWSLSYGALQRHLHAWWGGEDDDPDSGRPHLAAAAFHVLVLVANSLRGTGTDDRPGTPLLVPDQWRGRERLPELGAKVRIVACPNRPSKEGAEGIVVLHSSVADPRAYLEGDELGERSIQRCCTWEYAQ